MKLDYLIYYIIKLVKEGQKWQYQNLTNSGKRPTFWFSGLQIVAIIAAVVFVILQPEGILKENVIDYILSSLSIMTGIYLSLLVFVYDRYKLIDFKKIQDEHQQIRTWSFYSQLNSLISYSILVAIIVILILITSLLYGVPTNISDYVLADDFTISSFVLFLRCSFVVCMRLAMVYFLIDFFILCTYIVSGIFHFIHTDMEVNNPHLSITKTKSVRKQLLKEYPISYITTIILLMLLTTLVIGYFACISMNL